MKTNLIPIFAAKTTTKYAENHNLFLFPTKASYRFLRLSVLYKIALIIKS